MNRLPRRDVHTSSSSSLLHRQENTDLEHLRRQSMPSLPFTYPKPAPRRRAASFHHIENGSIKTALSSPICKSKSIMGPNLSEFESPATHRVTFSLDTASSDICQEEIKTCVVNLPWCDSHGDSVKYTGQVSGLMQPHGFGYAIQKDGSVISSIWNNGMPIKASAPQRVKAAIITESLPPLRRSRSRELDLGTIATPFDMKAPSPPERYEECNFPIHSFAFILRSNKQWSYAIVADRPVINGDECIRFVTDTLGSTKILKSRHWGKYIRLPVDD